MRMKKYRFKRINIFFLLFLLSSSVFADDLAFVTFADGGIDGGIRQASDGDDGLDSPGDVFVFDQNLLASDTNTVIGRNAGYCVRTDPGAPDFSSTDHPYLPDDPDNNYSQCSWTLTFEKNSIYFGSLMISGREADLGSSKVAIVGGTGHFFGVTGVLVTTPIPQHDGGTLFRQKLIIKNYQKDDND